MALRTPFPSPATACRCGRRGPLDRRLPLGPASKLPRWAKSRPFPGRLFSSSSSSVSDFSSSFPSPSPPSSPSSSSSSPSPTSPAHDIAILGAGITGLTTAYCLCKKFPKSKITVYESARAAGGCISTQSVDIGHGQHVLFETGPRTIRPAPGDATAALFHQVSLFKSKAVFTTKSSPAAKNRFIYYPDHIVKLPSPGPGFFSSALKTVLTEPLFKGVLKSVLKEPAQPQRTSNEDESVGAFLTRRLGPELTDNIVSAVFHGIYSGDIHQLSAQAVMPTLVARAKACRSLAESLFRMPPGSLVKWSDVHTHRSLSEAGLYSYPLSRGLKEADVSTWSFHEGFGNMVDQLAKMLETEMGVCFRFGSPVSKLKRSANGEKMKFITRTGSSGQEATHSADYVISTLPAHRLASITTNSDGTTLLPSLAQIPSCRVMTVNLYFPDKVLPIEGFGYLIPQSVSFDQNPEFALGVLFDSYATPNMNDHSGPGTKVTVMLGGHWWDSWSTLPTNDEGKEMALALLKRHLGITQAPVASYVWLHEDGIPQYTVGHKDRLIRSHHDLSAHFGGRVKVAGQSYLGIGVNACVASGASVSTDLPDTAWEHQTGLDVARYWYDVAATVRAPGPVKGEAAVEDHRGPSRQ